MIIIIILQLSFGLKWWRFLLRLFMLWYHYHFDSNLIVLWVLQIVKRFNFGLCSHRLWLVIVWFWCDYQWIYFGSITSIIYWRFWRYWILFNLIKIIHRGLFTLFEIDYWRYKWRNYYILILLSNKIII